MKHNAKDVTSLAAFVFHSKEDDAPTLLMKWAEEKGTLLDNSTTGFYLQVVKAAINAKR